MLERCGGSGWGVSGLRGRWKGGCRGKRDASIFKAEAVSDRILNRGGDNVPQT